MMKVQLKPNTIKASVERIRKDICFVDEQVRKPEIQDKLLKLAELPVPGSSRKADRRALYPEEVLNAMNSVAGDLFTAKTWNDLRGPRDIVETYKDIVTKQVHNASPFMRFKKN